MSLELHVTKSPYIVGNPVSEERLFGREDVFRYVTHQLTVPGNQVVTLFGQRRIGKSSVLHALPYRIPALRTVLLDLQALTSSATEAALIRATRQAVVAAIGLRGLQDSTGGNDSFWNEAIAITANQGQRLTLALDEADELDQERGPFSEYRKWLLALQRNHAELAFIFAVGRPPTRALHLQSLIKSGPSLALNVLDETSARRVLLTPDNSPTPLNFLDEAVKYAINLTGRHPFYLQALGAELFSMLGEGTTVTREHVQGAADPLLERTQPQLAWYWEAFGNAERTVLAALALILEENPQARLGDDQQAIRQISAVLARYQTQIDALDALAALKVLRDFRVLDANNYLQVEIVRRWLLREHSLARLRLTAQEKVERLYQDGRQAQARGHLREALTMLRQAVQEKPDFVPARLELASVFAQLHYYPEALQSYRAAFNMAPAVTRDRFEAFLMALAQDALDERQAARAVDYYQEALQLQGPRRGEIEGALRQIAPQQARISVDLIPTMILIPAGEFVHGLDWLDAARRLEKAGVSIEGNTAFPSRQIRNIGAFRISQTQITNAQYQQFMRDTQRQPPGDWTTAGDFPPGRDDYPVVYISWHDAQTFCKWLSERTGRRFRPPTEWEWEKAARGGLYLDGDRAREVRNPNPERLWPWGDDWQPPVNPRQLLTSGIDIEQLRERLHRGLTGRVGSEIQGTTLIKTQGLDYFFPSLRSRREGERAEPPRFLQAVQGGQAMLRQGPYGLAGLVGNVREWCDAMNDETGRAGDVLGRRVYKGAPAQLTSKDALCVSRQLAYPQERRPDVSFRIVEEVASD